MKFSSRIGFASVSIAIPTYNEVEHIRKVIEGFLQTSYPNLIEIIVADGGSIDGTQEVVNNLSLQDSRVRLIHNPLKVQAAGLNFALQNSRGDIFLRADAHCDYGIDYVEKCVEFLQESEALNVGGAQRFVATNICQAAIAMASKSFLGSGGAKYRNPEYNGFADTVFLGCFWRESLLKMGGYCIKSTPNEDAELNLRLHQLQYNAVYINSAIKVWYYPRKTWYSLLLQYFKYGKSRCLTTIKHPKKLQIRGQLPFWLISLLLFLWLLDSIFININFHFHTIITIGFFFPFLESLHLNYKYQKLFTQEIWRGSVEKEPKFFSLWLCSGLVMIAIPMAHCLGFGTQLLANKIPIFKYNFN